MEKGCLGSSFLLYDNKEGGFIDNSELLKYAVENGIIDLEHVQEEIHMKEREKILKEHPYSIWQGKDGKWRTYIEDKNKKNHRRMIKKTSKNNLDKAIVEWYKENRKSQGRKINEVFEEAKEYAVVQKGRKKSTITVYNDTYKKYFVNVKEESIETFTEDDLEKMYDRIVEENGKMSRSQYHKLRDVVKLIFRYARKKKYIAWEIDDVLSSFDIEVYTNPLQYRDSSDLVFTEEEMKRLNEEWKRKPDICNLTLAIIAGTGLRPGEAVAIRKSVVNGSVITVDKCEMKYDKDGKRFYEIQNTTKTPAGYRNVVCLPEYQWALDKLVNDSEDEWLCVENGKNLTTKKIRDRLYYTCKRLGIPQRSTDKLRKTVATYLAEIGVDDRDIIAQPGHTDISVTNNHYIKNRKPAQDRLKRFVSLQEKAIKCNQW